MDSSFATTELLPMLPSLEGSSLLQSSSSSWCSSSIWLFKRSRNKSLTHPRLPPTQMTQLNSQLIWVQREVSCLPYTSSIWISPTTPQDPSTSNSSNKTILLFFNLPVLRNIPLSNALNNILPSMMPSEAFTHPSCSMLICAQFSTSKWTFRVS